MSERVSSPSGTQVIRRISEIMRLIAERNRSGMRLVDLAHGLSLETPTAHRLLRGLASEGLVSFDPATKLYRLGPRLFELGLTAGARFDVLHVMTPALNRLIDETGDSVVATIRSGAEGVCIFNRAGSHPIQTSVVAVGSRRPLSAGAGGLAMLAAMEPDLAEEILRANHAGHARQLAAARERVDDARSTGIAANDYANPAPGISALGRAIRTRDGSPVAGIAVVAVGERLRSDRREEVASLLAGAADSIEADLADRH